MYRYLRSPTALALAAVAFLAPANADAFDPGQVYWAPNDCYPCGVFDVTDGGDQQGASPLVVIERAPGQFAWSSDLATAYITQYDYDTIIGISASGSTSTFASGIDGATGLIRTQDGRLLVASYRDGAVYDATSGGDLSGAVPFASGFGGPRNLLQLATGEILLADQAGRAVFDVTSGGDFSAEDPFASGFASDPIDLVQDGEGQIFVSTADGVIDITGGGDFSSPTLHATGQAFMGLAVATIDSSERLLASDFTGGSVFDITTGGDFSAAAPFASNLPGGYGDSALDTVPEAAPLPVPSLRGVPAALLAVLLVAIVAACCPRPAAGGTR